MPNVMSRKSPDPGRQPLPPRPRNALALIALLAPLALGAPSTQRDGAATAFVMRAQNGRDARGTREPQHALDKSISVDVSWRMTSPTAVDVARAAQLFHALSDETRLGILEMLRQGERCVCDLQSELDAAQSRLSYHLRVLKDAGLVADRREGRWSYYSILPDALGEVHDLAVALQPRKGALPVLRAGACCG